MPAGRGPAAVPSTRVQMTELAAGARLFTIDMQVQVAWPAGLPGSGIADRLIMALTRGRVEPSGRSRMARRWFSNWLVTAPSMVQWPELWTRGAISLAISCRRVTKNSIVRIPCSGNALVRAPERQQQASANAVARTARVSGGEFPPSARCRSEDTRRFRPGAARADDGHFAIEGDHFLVQEGRGAQLSQARSASSCVRTSACPFPSYPMRRVLITRAAQRLGWHAPAARAS